MIKTQYPLSLIEELLDRLGRVQHFTQLNSTNTYHQMRIREGDKWKIAFRICYNHFKYQVMPFGLSNVPARFHSYMNKILAKKLNIFVIIYLNDIYIYTKSKREEYVEVIQWILDQLQKHLLYANFKKYQFHQDKVRFLGYIISYQGI